MRGLFLLSLVALLGCGPTEAGPDGPAPSDPDCVETVTCAEDASACGVVLSGTCGEVDCGPCRFGSETVSENGTFLAGDDTGGLLRLLYVQPEDEWGRSGPRVLGVRGPAGWTVHPWFPEPSYPWQDGHALAADADGRVCSAMRESETLTIHCAMPGEVPTVRTLEAFSRVDAFDLAVIDGMPILILSAELETNQEDWRSGTFLARPDGEGWAFQPLDVTTGSQRTVEASLVPTPNGLWAFWTQTDTAELKAAWVSDADTVQPEVIEVGTPGVNYARMLNARLKEDGQPHLTYASGGTTRYAERHEDGHWSLESVGGRNRASALVEIGGVLHVAYHTAASLQYGHRREGVWGRQLLGPCDDGPVHMFNDAGQLRVIPSKSCNFSQGVKLLSPIAPYPREAAVACQETVAALCALSCDCADDDGDCCLSYTSGPRSGNTCTGTFGCKGNYNALLCASVTADPSVFLDCRDAATDAALTCREDHRVELPAACAPLLQ